MKSVGEAMSIGRTFKEALQKGLRSLETGWSGLDNHPLEKLPLSEIPSKLTIPNIERLFYIKQALRLGMSIDQLYDYTQIDPFFLYNIKEIVDFENVLAEGKDPILVRKAKQLGFSDKHIGEIWKMLEVEVREMRKELGIEVTFKTVDTCAAEFEAETPYYYSTYGIEDEVQPSKKKKIMILGGGPNRIGQGIEFDYCCVHAALALKEDGYETPDDDREIPINSNEANIINSVSKNFKRLSRPSRGSETRIAVM